MSVKDTYPDQKLCPCGSGKAIVECCMPVIEQHIVAQTAEQLMRSRYTAFVIQNEQYLLHSWYPDNRPDAVTFDPETKWLGLKIKSTQDGLSADQQGTVHFVARYKVAGKAYRLEEHSRFLMEDGVWYYLDASEI